MLLQLKESAEIVIVINASDIEKNKVRGDLGITYDVDVLRLIDAFRSWERQTAILPLPGPGAVTTTNGREVSMYWFLP